ncbi:MAG: CHASE2 domain-containing protein [Bacteroidetes bacterium]|nr:MAG: CHASE2 domain-containing protein [Bacteroidota bacterium]
MRFFSLDNIITTGVILLILKFFFVIFQIDFLNQLNNQIQDFQINDIVFSRLIDRKAVQMDTNIIIVNISDLKRNKIAEQINIINRFKPKTIGVDVLFSKEKGEDMDRPLADALSKVNNLVLVNRLVNDNEQIKLVKSIPLFSQYAHSGFANFIDEEDFRTVRKFSSKEFVDKDLVMAFSTKIAELYNPGAVNKLFERNNESEIIYFERNLNKYRVIDCDEVFRKKDNLDFVRGKIILFGFLGPDIKTLSTEDNFYTPMNPNYIGKSYPDMYGVVIHANIISMILNGKYINAMSDKLIIVLTIILTYLTMAFFTYLRFNHEEAYESLSLVFIFLEMGLFLTVMFTLLYYFNYYLNLKNMFFVLAVSEMVSESYFGSIKPLTKRFFSRIGNKLKISKP